MSRFTLSLQNLQRPAGNSATVSSSRTRSRWWRGGKARTGKNQLTDPCSQSRGNFSLLSETMNINLSKAVKTPSTRMEGNFGFCHLAHLEEGKVKPSLSGSTCAHIHTLKIHSTTVTHSHSTPSRCALSSTVDPRGV